MIVAISDTRPSRMTKDKDEDYHLRWGRYCIWAGYNNPIHTQWITRNLLHEQFYQGDQWNLNEDIEIFLKDESGDVRNRLQVRMNMIRNMMQGYIGNAIRMSINATARSVSPMSKTRRDAALAEKLFLNDVARKVPVFAPAIRKRTGIGQDKQETTQIFENLYTDNFVEAMNYLLEYVSSVNDFQDKQPFIAEQLALSGLGVLFNYEYAGEQRFKPILSKDFFWDRNTRDYALQEDCQFWGHFDFLNPPTIYEMYPQLSDTQKDIIESYDKRQPAATAVGYQQNVSRNGVPVANVYWRDADPMEYAYVLNDYGDIVLERINYTYPDEKIPRYTDRDIVPPPDRYEAKRLMGSKKKVTIYPDVIRFVKFVPYFSAPDEDPAKQKLPDTVLEYGVMPFQETNNEKYHTVRGPYSCSCWSYINGEVHSPLEDAIDTQRFINRAMSVVDEQIRNTGGAGPIIDSTVFLNKDDQKDALKNMQQGKPAIIDARGRGIQNVIGQYDMTAKAGVMNMFNLVNALKEIIQVTTGNNDAMQGQGQGPDQLVGVTQLMIERGSLLQEPFYNALTRIMLQAYQSIATRGKRIYIDNKPDLAIAVGDDAARVITLSKDMEAEDFRVFVKRDNAHDQLVSAADQMLMTLIQLGLLDQRHFGNLYGRSTPDQVAAAIREFAKEKMEMSRMQTQQAEAEKQEQQQQVQQIMQTQQSMQQQDQAHDDLKMAQKHQNDLEKIKVKAQVGAIYPKAQPQPVTPPVQQNA